MDQGAITLVLDLAEAFKRASLGVVWAWASHFQFPKKILRVFAAASSTRGGCSLKGALPIFFGSAWSSLLLRIVLQDAWIDVMKVYFCR